MRRLILFLLFISNFCFGQSGTGFYKKIGVNVGSTVPSEQFRVNGTAFISGQLTANNLFALSLSIANNTNSTNYTRLNFSFANSGISASDTYFDYIYRGAFGSIQTKRIFTMKLGSLTMPSDTVKVTNLFALNDIPDVRAAINSKLSSSTAASTYVPLAGGGTIVGNTYTKAGIGFENQASVGGSIERINVSNVGVGIGDASLSFDREYYTTSMGWTPSDNLLTLRNGYLGIGGVTNPAYHLDLGTTAYFRYGQGAGAGKFLKSDAVGLANWANLSVSDISDISSNYAPINNATLTGTVSLPSTTSIGSVSSTELSYVDGVTSNLQTQIDNKADKVSGKGFSTNDYTTTEKTKLGALPDNLTLQTALDSKYETLLSISSLQAYTKQNIARFDGSDWVKKSGNQTSNGGSYAGTIIRVDASNYWERKVDYVTPEMFGAVGDSLTDDTTPLQNAINSGLNIIFGKNKKYLVTKNSSTKTIIGVTTNFCLEIPNNIKIDGSGSTIKIANAQNATILINKDAGTTTNTNIEIRNLVINCNRANQTTSGGEIAGLLFFDVNNSSVENIRINNARQFGFRILKTVDSKFDKLSVYNSDGDGISFGLSSNSQIVKNCTINNLYAENCIQNYGSLQGNGAIFVVEKCFIGDVKTKNCSGGIKIQDLSNNSIFSKLHFIGGSNGTTNSGIKVQGNISGGLKPYNILIGSIISDSSYNQGLYTYYADNIQIDNVQTNYSCSGSGNYGRDVEIWGDNITINNISSINSRAGGVYLMDTNTVKIAKVFVQDCIGYATAMTNVKSKNFTIDNLRVIDNNSTITRSISNSGGVGVNIGSVYINKNFSSSYISNVADAAKIKEEIYLNSYRRNESILNVNTGDFTVKNGSNNVFFVDNTNNKVGIKTITPSADFHTVGTGKFDGTLSAQNILPTATNTYDIGSSSQLYNTLYARGINAGANQLPFTTNSIETMRIIAGTLNIGTTSSVSSALVNMSSSSKGFLPPRMTATQASAISSPAEGLMVYVTDTNGTFTAKGWWGWNGSAWKQLDN